MGAVGTDRLQLRCHGGIQLTAAMELVAEQGQEAIKRLLVVVVQEGLGAGMGLAADVPHGFVKRPCGRERLRRASQ